VSGFLTRLEGDIRSRGLLDNGERILVAVSGGLDSMTLLQMLQALAGKSRWKITVAHFNHQLRGRSSDADENLVRSTAKSLGLAFVSGRADVKQFAQEAKLSLEMAARKLRHEFLARVARDQRIPVVALAHHADDQVELFFLRVLRGTGGEGLAGMKWRGPSPADPELVLVRPLLGFSKAELREQARENKLRFREDATNAQLDAPRNRVRNELLPLLRNHYQSGLTKTVLRLMEIVGAEADLASAAAQEWLKIRGKKTCRGVFENLPVAVQRKILQRQLVGLGLAADFELVERLRGRSGRKESAGCEFSVARDMVGRVRLQREVVRKFNGEEIKLRLNNRSGRVQFGGGEFRWQIKRSKRFQRPHKQPGREIFNADKIGDEIVLRHWRAGDRFQPIGLPTPVKLQDLFVNAKIPAATRRDLTVAATPAGEIFWVEGLRIGERFRLTPATVRQLVWNWSNLPKEFALQRTGE
jgi:tRNA(Ile)-lysidine synthase